MVTVSEAGFGIAAMELAAAEVFFGVIWLKSSRSRLVAISLWQQGTGHRAQSL